MSIVCIDPGHGGDDPGGQSLGVPEKEIALAHGLAIGKALEGQGVTVVYTRTDDTYPSLARRADIANDAKADLFLSVHANASGDPKARGPWTIYAKGSTEGRSLAKMAQWVLVAAYGGRPDAFYPDESPWVGNRRLAVLRQTKMPAILLELGFMTNARDIRTLEDPVARDSLARVMAGVIAGELDEGVQPQPVVTRPPLPSPPHLERIEIPEREHVDAIIRARLLSADVVEDGLRVAEALLLGVLAGQSVKEAGLKAAADAVSDWIRGRVA